MRRSSAGLGFPRSRIAIVALLMACLPCAGSTGASLARTGSSSAYAVSAVRQSLTTKSNSTVAHDNEVMALSAHAGRLFAATDQWEYPGPSAYGQILVKSSSHARWKVFEQTQSTRVQALDSFSIPTGQGFGPGHSLLITQAIVKGRSAIQWLLDRAGSFRRANSFALRSPAADVRSFGAHKSGGVWAVYAGVNPTGILRGTWSRRTHTLVFSRTPELTGAAPGSKGLKTQKVTGFADCGGALYASINTRLYRRNDGPLPRGVARWVLVYQAPPVGAHNSGLRGLTCVIHDGSRSLLFSTEGNGDVYRIDGLPRGQLHDSATASPSHGLTRLLPTLEFSPIPAIRHMMASEGTVIPATGSHSIDYVIAAYNNFETIKIGGVTRQLFGFERGYAGGCPPTRTCGPTAFGAVTFDAAACFAIRTDHGRSPSYALRCLSGRQFTPSGRVTTPIRASQAFVSIRTIKPSPFGDGRLYYGGYDCNFHPADGTAWIAASTLSALHLANARRADHP